MFSRPVVECTYALGLVVSLAQAGIWLLAFDEINEQRQSLSPGLEDTPCCQGTACQSVEQLGNYKYQSHNNTQALVAELCWIEDGQNALKIPQGCRSDASFGFLYAKQLLVVSAR